MRELSRIHSRIRAQFELLLPVAVSLDDTDARSSVLTITHHWPQRQKHASVGLPLFLASHTPT